MERSPLGGECHRPEAEVVELFLGFFPGWIAVFGVSLALLVPLVQSCRESTREDVEQTAPPNTTDADP